MSKTAFLFPGQGSQAVGMGRGFAKHPQFQELFDQANQVLGFDLQKLCLEGPADQLTLTQNAQPAILTVSTIAQQIFQERFHLKPAYAAGHSLGEYSALVAAQAIPFAKAVQIVHSRGKLMQEAVPLGVGGMAAILGMEAAALENLCREASSTTQRVQCANYNTSAQIVISGHIDAVKRVLEQAKGKLLEVSAPFHSPLMHPAALKLKTELEQVPFANAQFPIINNIANQELVKAGDILPSLVAQVTGAVRWETGIQKMIAQGVTHFIEFGQGRVLAGMMKRIDKSVRVINLQCLDDLESNQEALQALI